MTTPTFCNELASIKWKAHNLIKYYLNVARESQKSFLRLLLLIRVNAASLSYFDTGQNFVARQLRVRNFEMFRSVVHGLIYHY